MRSTIRLLNCSRLRALRYAAIALATSGLDTYSSGSSFLTGVPTSTRIRVIGPFTCVMACVVWSWSQSTVPVVWIATPHEALATEEIFKCAIWSGGRVNNPGCVLAPGAVLLWVFFDPKASWDSPRGANRNTGAHATNRNRRMPMHD